MTCLFRGAQQASPAAARTQNHNPSMKGRS